MTMASARGILFFLAFVSTSGCVDRIGSAADCDAGCEDPGFGTYDPVEHIDNPGASFGTYDPVEH